MSAQTARVYDFPNSKRAPQAQPVAKLRVLEHIRGLIGDGELQHVDMTVAAYIAEITDKATGWARVEYATIGERIGRHRSTAVRSVGRLIDAGVIERTSRRDGSRCFASLYRLVEPEAERTAASDTPSVHECTYPGARLRHSRAFEENLFPSGLAPDRERGRGNAPRYERRFWDDQAEWLARHSKYARWGPGPGEAFRLANDDLERWRERSGDLAVVAAIRKAKRGNGGNGWFGDYLIVQLGRMLGE